ncbi:MAG: GNAT family N-acetyltransferase [Ktedonobacteraceae bacterium]
MPVFLRPLIPETDFPRFAELLNTVEPETITSQVLHDWLESEPADRIRRRITAVDERGYVVGFSDVGRDSWMEAGRFWLSVIVDAAWQRQGTGSRLFEDALQCVQEQNATLLETEVRDHLPTSLRFAEQHGFTIDRYLYESTLDVTTFDERPFSGAIEAVEAQGIRFHTLADMGDTLEAQRNLYEINRRYAFDVPGREQTFAPFERFRKQVFAAIWYRADGQIVALDGDRWVGMSAVGYFEEANFMINMMTGVEPSYRGRGIAFALKLLTIRCARRYGAAYIRTSNDSANAPILAINRKLGYQPQPGKYLMLRRL